VSTGQRLIAVGAVALVAALVFRAASSALDLSPVATILIFWAVITLVFGAFVLIGRRG